MQIEKEKQGEREEEAEAGFESVEAAFAGRRGSLLAAKDLDYYFDSYSQVGIHYDMLSDRARTLCYRNALEKSGGLLRGRRVMDIGCGTGILSMFAARAGAASVLAIEMASILNAARRIVAENGLAQVISFHGGRVEELQLEAGSVDVIVSEWMGYLLLYEGMLDSVLHARDRFLAPGGLLFPNRERILLAGFENFRFADAAADYHCYKGVDFGEYADVHYMMPDVDLVSAEALLTDEACVADIDLQTVTVADLDFRAEFALTASRHGYVHGLALWFDSLFSHGEATLNLSTSPHGTPTHWKQGLMYLRVPLPVRAGDKVRFTLALKKHAHNPRSLDLRLDYELRTDAATIVETQYFLFK